MYTWSSPAMWSFGTGNRGEEFKTNTNYHTPGPGTYKETTQNSYKTAYPSWKVGKSQRGKLYSTVNVGVGPGSYQVITKDVKRFEKKTFSKGVRGQSEFRGIPAVGPGSYEAKTSTGTAQAFTFGYKADGLQSTEQAKIPGPGAYDIKGIFDDADQMPAATQSAFTRTAPHAMSRAKDAESRLGSNPGPGEHFNSNIDNFDFRYFAPTWSFGTSTRDDLYNELAKTAPGPGKYNIAGTIKTKGGFTILAKHQPKNVSSDTPGPNVYNPRIDPLRQTAPAFRIGKAERTAIAPKSNVVPGPGAYHQEARPETTKGTRIGTSQRPGLYSQGATPGPGAYTLDGEVGKTAKYSMGAKCNLKKMADVLPGPGEYDPYATLYMEKTNGAVIGESQRPALYKKGIAPGPGQYDVRKNLGGTQTRFGTARRVPIAKVTDEPGPGYYQIPSAIGNVARYVKPAYPKGVKKSMSMDENTSFKGVFA